MQARGQPQLVCRSQLVVFPVTLALIHPLLVPKRHQFVFLAILEHGALLKEHQATLPVLFAMLEPILLILEPLLHQLV